MLEGLKSKVYNIREAAIIAIGSLAELDDAQFKIVQEGAIPGSALSRKPPSLPPTHPPTHPAPPARATSKRARARADLRRRAQHPQVPVRGLAGRLSAAGAQGAQDAVQPGPPPQEPAPHRPRRRAGAALRRGAVAAQDPRPQDPRHGRHRQPLPQRLHPPQAGGARRQHGPPPRHRHGRLLR